MNNPWLQASQPQSTPTKNLTKWDTLSLDNVKSKLEYSLVTGNFVWLVGNNRKVKAGDVAGCVHPTGYVVIKFEGKFYPAHILAWFYMTGEIPANLIDHKDLNKSNNKWNNLREATSQENALNRKVLKTNKLGIKGIYEKYSGRYCAQFIVKGKTYYLGLYDTIDAATIAYKTAIQNIKSEFVGA